MKKKVILISCIIALFVTNTTFAWVRLGYNTPSNNPRYTIHGTISSNWMSSVQYAANTWNNVNAGVQFSLDTYPDYRTVDFYDSVFHVAYQNFQIYAWPSTANGAFAYVTSGNYGDIVLNSTRIWGNGNSTSYLDRQGILTHEFGHCVGLSDVRSNADAPADYMNTTMYAFSDYYLNNSYGMRTLHYDDINGIRALWP